MGRVGNEITRKRKEGKEKGKRGRKRKAEL